MSIAAIFHAFKCDVLAPLFGHTAGHSLLFPDDQIFKSADDGFFVV
jgi:hypothetical protein